jgi:hypothetical protein
MKDAVSRGLSRNKSTVVYGLILAALLAVAVWYFFQGTRSDHEVAHESGPIQVTNEVARAWAEAGCQQMLERGWTECLVCQFGETVSPSGTTYVALSTSIAREDGTRRDAPFMIYIEEGRIVHVE